MGLASYFRAFKRDQVTGRGALTWIYVLPAFLVALFFSLTAFTGLGTYLGSDTVVDFFQSRTLGHPRDMLVRMPFQGAMFDLFFFRLPPEIRFSTLAALQHVLILIEVWLIFSLFAHRGRSVLGGIAALGWALTISNYIWAQGSWSESPYAFFVICTCYFVVRGMETGQLRMLAIAGVFAGLTFCTRRMGLPFIPMLLFAGLFRWGWFRVFPPFIVFMACWGAVVSLFSWWNADFHGRFVLSEESGVHLFHRVTYYDTDYVEKEPWTTIQEIVEEKGINLADIESGWPLRRALKAEFGLSDMDADGILGEFAKAEILDDPIQFALNSIDSFQFCIKPLRPASEYVSARTGLTVEDWWDFENWHQNRLDTYGWSGWYPEFRAEFQDYPPRAAEGSWRLRMWDWLDKKSPFGVLWQGQWVFWTLVGFGVMALVLRDPQFIFLAGTCGMMVAIVTSGERPQERFWLSAMPVFMLCFWWCVGWVTSKIQPRLGKRVEG